MATLQDLLRDIESAPEGPQIAAIFDFDGTIIAGYSATVFIREQIRRGDISPRQLVELTTAMTSFGMGNLGFSAMMAVSTQFMRGIEESVYEEVGEKLFREQIARRIYPESRALIQAHQARGHTVAVISSATPYQVEPAARDLGIPNVLCTQLEVKKGRFTGQVLSPTCFGQGKVDAAEQLAAEYGANLDKSFFYSDSTDDLQLLERVGKPRALNPSARLAGVASDRQWPVGRFGSRGRPTVSQWVRSVAATVSLVPSFAAGLPIYALTGSRRDSLNFSFSLFADTASALIGLHLNVTGEEHLWSHRPAVFIFNHQSKADVVIMASLLRRDIAGVGKKEIKKLPVIGKVLEMGGVVMIDRANARSAIEAMAPLVDAMRDEGKSVALAPEGTRSVGPRLQPFKKGAFHLAMQAGVPIVPVVIRNAGDVAPKGDFVFRSATVDVEVLPPVDTSEWRREDIDEHVRDVRNRFLAALQQPLEDAPARQQRRRAPTRKKAAGATAGSGKTRAPAKKKTPAKKKAAAKTKKTSTSAGGRTTSKARRRVRPKGSGGSATNQGA
ncbi:HAD-IB family hydrolase [Parahaliea mediterranea]|uniref:HAD-IB family hydrolase n=1 Tax=Parahaliea mediterranea TaxID=651086 RepID=UPI000E2EFB26|nr:HAD-IB family hydrolase [Parahaliea mediterranea]